LLSIHCTQALKWSWVERKRAHTPERILSGEMSIAEKGKDDAENATCFVLESETAVS